MKVAFQKWGNSLALRVPKAVAQEIGASDGKAAEMSVRDGKLVIEVTKPKKRRFTLDELVAGITPENRHEEVDWGRQLATKSGDYCPDAGDLIWTAGRVRNCQGPGAGLGKNGRSKNSRRPPAVQQGKSDIGVCDANLDASAPSASARACMSQKGYALVQKDQAEEVRAAYAKADAQTGPRLP
jgi:antitoxin MazE